MPYYKEQRASRVTSSVIGSSTQLPIVWDSSKATTFRSRPHSKSLVSKEILDQEADPYAYFLENISERKYAALVKERGLPAEGGPDRGHAFELNKHIVTGPTSSFVGYDSYNAITTPYKGVVVFPSHTGPDPLGDVHDGGIFGPASYKETGLDTFAQSAYNKLAPTTVEFDAAQFLGELREGIPKFSSSALKNVLREYKFVSRKTVGEAGSDYLNAAFGWKPLLSDLQNAAKALMSATQLLANQGQRVHRRMSLPPVLQTGEVFLTGKPNYVYSGTYGLLDAAGKTALQYPRVATASGQLGTADMDYLKVRSTRRWFEGEFSSFFPLGFDPTNFFDRFNQLVKVNPSPSTLWQLAPWSWLVDWQFHIEATISANEKAANDLLVMHYGYAMEKTVYKTAISWKQAQSPDSGFSKFTSFPQKGQMYSETSYLRRLRANPYGFRIGGSQSLTGGQIAILGALGLTRLK